MSPRLARWERALWWAAGWLYRVYHATLRIRATSPDGSAIAARGRVFGGEVYAVLERDLLALGGLVAGAGLTVLVTPGRDGDRAAAVARALGCRVVRGSSRHDGRRALRELLSALAAAPSSPAAIVVDGPLGPAAVPKPGAVVLGVLARRPVRAVASAARRRLVVPRTWSGIYLPLPFARVRVVLDGPLPLPEVLKPADLEGLAAQLGDRLRRLAELASAGPGNACYHPPAR